MTSDRPTLEQLMEYSRYGKLDDSQSGIEIVSEAGNPLRVVISYGRHSVVLQERKRGHLQVQTGRGRRRHRESTGTSDWREAVERADRELRKLVLADQVREKAQLASEIPDAEVELSTLFAYVAQKRFPPDPEHPISDKHVATLQRIIHVVTLRFGHGYKLGDINPASFVAEYIRYRTTMATRFPPGWKRSDLGRVEVRTAIRELKDFSGMISYCRSQGLIQRNPLEGYQYQLELKGGDQHAEEHREEASLERYGLLMSRPAMTGPDGRRLAPPVERISALDGGARLRVGLAMLFHFGRRVGVVHGTSRGGKRFYPRVADVAFDRADMERLLRQAPNHRTWWAECWPHGCIYFRVDKEDYRRVVPFSRRMSLEMRRWLERHPDPRPNAPLVPGVRKADQSQPVSYTGLRYWLEEALSIARRDALHRQDEHAQFHLRELSNSLFHGLRSAWETTMSELGWSTGHSRDEETGALELNKHSAFFGGWDVAKRGDVQSKVYQRLNPEILLAVAEMEPAEVVLARFAGKKRRDISSLMNAIYDEEVLPIDLADEAS